MVPWKNDIEHANERPFVQVANVADRDIFVDLFRRGRIRALETVLRVVLGKRRRVDQTA